tara:strand:- start:116 stop:427 length:312 start_codon:yes stop_codon:yes gene_type:complete
MKSIVIDLNKESLLNEGNIFSLGSSVKLALWNMFGHGPMSAIDVKGTTKQVAAFGEALRSEKSYMDTHLRYGSGHPQTLRDHAKLQNSINKFESATGLKWPIE